jgi:hypothetical protein
MKHLQCRASEHELITLQEQKSSEEEIVKNLSGLILVLGLTLALPAVAQAAEQAAQSQDGGAKPAKCLEAAVNPVTGYAVCVNPVGAPVDPPPVSSLQPCKPRAHDSEAWTTYEHYSGCGD